jgi:sarcosine oxidase, subunit gamma
MAEAIIDITGKARLLAAPPLARFVFQGSEAVAAHAGAPFGLPFPTAINSGVSVGGRGQPGARVALKLGPEEFWLIVPEAEGAAVAETLRQALSGEAYALVDVSHRQLGFVLEGPAAETLLASGCPLDLDERSFPAGMATRTLFHKTEVMLWRMGASVFRVEIMRSFASYFEAMLREAALDL